MPSQDFIDKGLIPDATATCFFTELIEHSGIDSNRDQLARLVAERRPALAEAARRSLMIRAHHAIADAHAAAEA